MAAHEALRPPCRRDRLLRRCARARGDRAAACLPVRVQHKRERREDKDAPELVRRVGGVVAVDEVEEQVWRRQDAHPKEEDHPRDADDLVDRLLLKAQA